MKNEAVLQTVMEERNIVPTVKRRRDNWIGHILRRNCFLKQVIEGTREGRLEVKRGRGRRRKQQLDDLNTLRTGTFKLFKCTFPGTKQFKSTFILCFFKNL